jgi:hypothetical protein
LITTAKKRCRSVANKRVEKLTEGQTARIKIINHASPKKASITASMEVQDDEEGPMHSGS